METLNPLNRLILTTTLVLAGCASDSDAHETAAKGPETSAKAPINDDHAAPESARTENAKNAQSDSSKGKQPELDVKTPLKDLPADCQGFKVEGLKTSPGGTVLPNRCAPFHGLYNNPYAIRCVDADPGYKTDYPGDEFCILPPPDDLGTQVHVGPKDFKQPGRFEMAPGTEENTMYYVNAPNTDDHFYYRTNWRMRAGSHHMIINVSDTDREDGWAADLAGSGGGSGARNIGGLGMDPNGRSFGGSQRPDLDRPQGTLDVPPENVGIGAQIKAKQQFSFNLHHINTGETRILREAWVNVWYLDEKDVTKKMQPLTASGSPLDVAIPAHERTILKYKCDVQGDSRIITMNGHRHAHTDRFSVWVKKQSGEEVRAYESFNWEDMPTFQYDSISTNPMPNVDNKTDGASSGELQVSQGDELHFLCDINNTLDVPLKFANEAIDGEMCILFGSYIGDMSPCSGGAKRIKDED